MNRVDVAELRRLHEAATPGVWSAETDPTDPEYHRVVSSLSGLTASMEQGDVYGWADAELIAAMHEALPALLGVYESVVWDATPEERAEADERVRWAKEHGILSPGRSAELDAIARRALERIAAEDDQVDQS